MTSRATWKTVANNSRYTPSGSALVRRVQRARLTCTLILRSTRASHWQVGSKDHPCRCPYVRHSALAARLRVVAEFNQPNVRLSRSHFHSLVAPGEFASWHKALRSWPLRCAVSQFARRALGVFMQGFPADGGQSGGSPLGFLGPPFL